MDDSVRLSRAVANSHFPATLVARSRHRQALADPGL
jgi:hypothetical protein